MNPVEICTDVIEVFSGPTRSGSEQRWQVRTRAGNAVFASLLPELAKDTAVRRRYLRDVERRAKLQAPGLAAVTAHSDPDAPVPWRLRDEPSGELLATWIERMAPGAPSDVSELGAQIADVLEALHAEGVVVRDLGPRSVVLTEDGPVLTDVGLARIDVLSTRTAASLVLEGSPYASPEQLRKTIVDGRSDLYSLGVMLWQMLTDTLPHGDGLAILRPDDAVPSLAAVRSDVPASFCRVIERCIEAEPDRRPASAGEVARALRGGSLPAVVERTTCQSCGADLRLGQRLCTNCGRLGVVFKRAKPGDPEAKQIVLTRMKEDAGHMAALTSVVDPLTPGALPPLNFIVGDARMYSKEERSRAIKLPRVLFDDLDPGSAAELQQRFERAGLKTRVRDAVAPNDVTKAVWIGLGTTLALTVFLAMTTILVAAIPVLAVGLLGTALVAKRLQKRRGGTPLLQLRSGPAALPASDPLVARLAALTHSSTPPDVRERLGELALAVQNLVDHRARMAGRAEKAELDAVTEPLRELIALVEKQVGLIATLDHELETLDEGALVRGLAAAKARGATETEHETLLAGLDRLRALEDDRAQALNRLLEATSLIQRSVELGLGVADEQAAVDREVALALQQLG